VKTPPHPFLLLAAAALALAGCATTEPAKESAGPAPAAGTTFKLNDVREEVLVVIGFDMYCHVCQAEAPRMVKFARAIKAQPGGSRVKVIGLGIGDTPMETATFASKFGLPFPTYSDRSNAIAKSIATPVRVPSIMILKRTGSGFRLVDRKSKIPADIDAFAGEVVSLL